MTDYYGIALAGFFTGVGVIVAQKLVNWLDAHPLMTMLKKRFLEMRLLKDMGSEARRRMKKRKKGW